MAYPVKPTPHYDYVTFQAGEPTTPLPADQVAIDLDNQETAIDAIIDFIQPSLRSDGALQNGAVTPDSLAASTLVMIGGWNPRGIWTTATAYAIRDVVEYTTGTYVCVVAHTSGTFASDVSGGKWIAMERKGQTFATSPTLDTSAYANGDVLWATFEIPNFFSVAGGREDLQSAQLVDFDAQKAQLRIYFFDSNQSIGTVNTAANVDAVAAHVLGVVDVFEGDYNTDNIAPLLGLNVPLQAAAAQTSIWMAAVSLGTPTHTAAGMSVTLSQV